MNRNFGGMAAAALAWVLVGPAVACDEAREDRAGAATPALSQALDQLRAEQREQMRSSAQRALAQLRSETASAVAQGASTGSGAAVRSRP